MHICVVGKAEGLSDGDDEFDVLRYPIKTPKKQSYVHVWNSEGRVS